MLVQLSGSLTALVAPGRSVVDRLGRVLGWPIAVTYAGLAVALLAYLIALIVRPADASWPLLDSWGVAGFELLLGALCLTGTLRRRQTSRSFGLSLSGALLAWATGDLLLAIESIGGTAPMPPSLADLFYLGFYPLAYVAIVVLVRQEISEFLPATWLDGAIAGLGAAALCAAFAFSAIVKTLGGNVLAVATNLAYPIGDVLLFGLAAGGTAILARHRPPWYLVATACALNAVGDTFNLVNSAGKTSHLGQVFDGIAWPVAILLMSLVVWLPRTKRSVERSSTGTGFLLPAFGATASLAILVVGSLRHMIPIAIGLSTLTLAFVGARLALSIRTLGRLNEKRRRLANTDELTGLGNRRELLQALNGFFAGIHDGSAANRRLAFLFIDLDHFKEINDSFGHAAGDELLRQLGPRLKASLRSSDLLVRLGGDELGVLLVDTDPDYVTVVAQRQLAALQVPFLLGDVSVRISASVGIAVAPTDANDVAGLLHCADVAMYRAKEKKTSIEVYSRELQYGADQLRLVNEIRAAIADKHFVLYYQPQVDLRTQQVTSFEALLRWPHPRLGMVPPLKFLPLAEETGLMDQVTALVLEQSLADAAAWQPHGQRTVSINISTSNLLNPGFVDLVSSGLHGHQLAASMLVLEITETTVLREFDRARRVIDRLHELGLQISIDDFGAGFTSLAYLGELALSEIKLDRAFTLGLTSSSRSRQLVRATIDLCHALGLRVVAEGIEDQATFDVLKELDCDLGQGFFTGKPQPVSQIVFQPKSGRSADQVPSQAA